MEVYFMPTRVQKVILGFLSLYFFSCGANSYMLEKSTEISNLKYLNERAAGVTDHDLPKGFNGDEITDKMTDKDLQKYREYLTIQANEIKDLMDLLKQMEYVEGEDGQWKPTKKLIAKTSEDLIFESIYYFLTRKDVNNYNNMFNYYLARTEKFKRIRYEGD
jgi:hypothetical protein